MRKIIFFIVISLYSILLLFSCSKIFLVGGSDVIEFVYSMPLIAKLISILLVYICGYFSFFWPNNGKILKAVFAVAFLLSIISSQSVVYSGKRNVVEYYVFGISLDSFAIDPTGGDSLSTRQNNPFITKVFYKNESVSFISLLYPFQIDLSGIEKY